MDVRRNSIKFTQTGSSERGGTLRLTQMLPLVRSNEDLERKGRNREFFSFSDFRWLQEKGYLSERAEEGEDK